jgi:hypothetical protein
MRRNMTTATAVLAVWLPASTIVLAGQSMDERVLQLEAQVRDLSDRLNALEQAGAPASASGAAEEQVVVGDAGVVWLIDDYVGKSPFRVSYKAFDPTHGRIELLLQVTAPLDNPSQWSSQGAEVPVAVTLRGAGGEEAQKQFVLGRGMRAEPGSHLHLYADIDPAWAAAARQLVVERAARE